MRPVFRLLTFLSVVLLLTNQASADQLRRLTDGPIANHPEHSLTSNLGCAGALYAVVEHYKHGASKFSKGYGRDDLEKMMFAFRRQAVFSYYKQTGLSQQEYLEADISEANRIVHGVILNGVHEMTRLFSYPYQYKLVPKALKEPDDVIAVVQADISYCLKLSETRQ